MKLPLLVPQIGQAQSAGMAPKGVLVANTGYSDDEAQQAIAAAAVDALAFGTAFLANPDLPERIRRGADLNAPDPSSFYSPGPAGYTDYPGLDPAS
jgi:N-ethylmaleimide reductase